MNIYQSVDVKNIIIKKKIQQNQAYGKTVSRILFVCQKFPKMYHSKSGGFFSVSYSNLLLSCTTLYSLNGVSFRCVGLLTTLDRYCEAGPKAMSHSDAGNRLCLYICV